MRCLLINDKSQSKVTLITRDYFKKVMRFNFTSFEKALEHVVKQKEYDLWIVTAEIPRDLWASSPSCDLNLWPSEVTHAGVVRDTPAEIAPPYFDLGVEAYCDWWKHRGADITKLERKAK